jgi:gamma-glutamylcyclotransferase (GGCT)/AIG2-like uncharacterized protein YtfP
VTKIKTIRRFPLLYFAYGSNLCVEQMKERCPKARKIGKLICDDARLIFRGTADFQLHRGSRIAGGLWEITRECKENLDMFEGANGDNQTYKRRYFKTEYKGEMRDVLIYQMNLSGVMLPSESYLDLIEQGYRDFGLPLDLLDKAVAWTAANEQTTEALRQRYRRAGSPSVARALRQSVELEKIKQPVRA